MAARKWFLLTVSLVEWIALIIQLVLILQNSDLDTSGTLIQFFSYFTILTNLLVAIYTTVLWLKPDDQQKGWLYTPSTGTAITLYILVVGLIFNLILRKLWAFVGLQAVIHDVLHTLTPILVVIYWWKWVSGSTLAYKQVPGWLVYPAVYALIVMIIGTYSGWYPYPFLDVVTHGYAVVFRNMGMMIGLFLVLALLLVLIGKKKPR